MYPKTNKKVKTQKEIELDKKLKKVMAENDEIFRKIMERRKAEEEWRKNRIDPNADKYEAGRKMMEEARRRQDQGEILDPFIKKWLAGEICAARTALVIGMLLTVLIKGQIVIWAIMYFAYRGRVKKVTEEARTADRKKANR